MPELLMGATLAALSKTHGRQDGYNLTGLENRDVGHASDDDGLRTDILGLDTGLTLFQ